MRLVEASKIINKPTEYEVALIDKKGALEKINYTYGERTNGSRIMIDGIDGCVVHLNYLQAKGEQSSYDAFKNTRTEDFIHIFIPHGYYTKRRTMIYAGRSGTLAPIYVPLSATNKSDEETCFCSRSKDTADEIFDEKDQIAILDFCRMHWESIRRCSESGSLSAAPAKDARAFVCRIFTPKDTVWMAENAFVLFVPTYGGMNI